MVKQAQLGQDHVEGAIIGADDVLPDHGLNNQGGGPGEDHQGAHQLAAPEFLIKHHGQHKTDQGGEAHYHNGPHDGIPQGGPEGGRGEDFLVVVKPVEAFDAARAADLRHGEPKHGNNGQDNHNTH